MKGQKAWAIWLVALLFLVLVSNLSAEEKHGGFGAGYFSFGPNWIQISKLNAVLTSAGYSPLTSHVVALGGGGFGGKKRLIWGGEGFGFSSGSVTAHSNEIRLGGGYGLFNLGYLLYKRPRLGLYPLLGFGGGGFSLQIASQNKPASFEALLQKPEGNLQLTSGEFLLNVGVGFYTLLATPKRPDRIGGFLLGIRVGYLISAFRSNWTAGNEEIPNSPEAPFAGPYIHFMIGGGGGKISR